MMNSIPSEPRARKVTFDEDNMWVELTDGRQLGVPLAYFPRLLNASATQRKEYIISGGGAGLHWDDLDEDISVQSLLLGIGDRTKQNRKASWDQANVRGSVGTDCKTLVKRKCAGVGCGGAERGESIFWICGFMWSQAE